MTSPAYIVIVGIYIILYEYIIYYMNIILLSDTWHNDNNILTSYINTKIYCYCWDCQGKQSDTKLKTRCNYACTINNYYQIKSAAAIRWNRVTRDTYYYCGTREINGYALKCGTFCSDCLSKTRVKGYNNMLLTLKHVTSYIM